jgi:MYXO-CTERM domain-containing protein
VNFDQDADRLKIYVNESLLADVDMTTFASGAYMNYSNGAVGIGGFSGVHWRDNFQVGGAGAPPIPDPPLPDPGNLASPPAGLISYWDFNEADSPQPGFLLNFAYDRVGSNDGSFEQGATRIPGALAGLVGVGAAAFDNVPGTGVRTGSALAATTGIAVEAMIMPQWSGEGTSTSSPLDYDSIFRKEDGGNRVLLAFQNDTFNGASEVPSGDGPVLSFGLNVGGVYGELDMPLDGVDGRPTLADLQDGFAHHVVATYDSTTGVKAIWIDGVMRMSVNLGPGNLIASGGAANAFIGNSVAGGGEAFTGFIDEVAYWDRALAAGEIASHYQNVAAGRDYFTVPEPNSAALAMLAVAGVTAARRRKSAA